MKPWVVWVLLVLATGVGCLGFPGDGQPCAVYSSEVRPLLLGDSSRLAVGEVNVSDCNPKVQQGFRWSTADSGVVRLGAGGQVTGLRPGVFQASAIKGKDTLRFDGFVLPRDWRIVALPESATVRVGERLSLEIRARDAAGGLLPPVPYSVYTPEFGNPGQTPLFDKYSHQLVVGPTAFVARRPGSTELVGEIGRQRLAVPVSVTTADAGTLPTQRYRSAVVDSQGQLQIVTTTGVAVKPEKDSGQVGFERVAISARFAPAGW